MCEQARTAFCRLFSADAFTRGVGVLAGGTVAAQLLFLLTAPLLTRLYSPENFGLLAVYSSLLALIGVVSSLRYELAIPLPDNDIEAANIVILSLLIVALSTLLTGLLVAQFGPAIATNLNVSQLAAYQWLLPIGVLLSSTYSIFTYWSIRTRHFSTLAGTKLQQALASIVIQLTAFKFGGIALLFAHVAGQSLGAISLARSGLTRRIFHQASGRGVWQAACRYRRFPMFSSWAGLLNTGGTKLPPIMIAVFFSTSGAGLYALAYRLLTLPTALFGSAIKNVFFAGAAEAHRNNQLAGKVEKLVDILVQVALPPIFILALSAPEVFGFFFGASWEKAGIFAQWMTPMLFIQFCTAPLTSVNLAAEKQHLDLIMQFQLFIVRIAMVAIGAYYNDLLLTIILFSLGSTFSYLLFLWNILKIVGLPISAFFKPLLRAVFFSVILVLPIVLFSDFHADVSTFLCVSIAVFALAFGRYFLLVRFKF